MLYFLSIFLVLLGLFFICFGLLFVNYKASPLSRFIDKKYIGQSSKLGLQIMIPGFVLIFLATKIMNY